jgi:hypothetical protein
MVGRLPRLSTRRKLDAELADSAVCLDHLDRHQRLTLPSALGNNDLNPLDLLHLPGVLPSQEAVLAAEIIDLALGLGPGGLGLPAASSRVEGRV